MKFSSIYPNFRECEIQLFSDKGSKEAEHFPVGERSYEYMVEKNNQGMGVFFTINRMERGKCSKDGVLGINAWAVDIDEKDGLTKEEQLEIIGKSPLMPSLLVESGGGYHAYWFAKDGTIENRSKIQKLLRDYYNGDQKIVTDTSRVLRLPGFYHNKGDPFLVEFHTGDLEPKTEKEMEDAFRGKVDFKAALAGAKKSLSKTKPGSVSGLIKKKEEKIYFGDSVFDKARRYNQMDLLRKLSGCREVSGERFDFSKNANGTYQILVNDKPTGNRIDRDGMIGASADSGKDGGPSIIERLRYYGNSNKDIHSVLKRIL